MLAQLQQRQREIVLIVVRIAADGIAVNLFSVRRIIKVRVDISQQSQVGIVCAALLRNLLRSIESLRIKALAEISIRKIELDIVGIWIYLCSSLEVLDGIVVQMVASKLYPRSGQDPLVVCASLIELRDRAFRLLHFSRFQISLSQQV